MEKVLAGDGRKSRSLIKKLLTGSNRYDFYSAVHRLEEIFSDTIPIGEGVDPAGESIRFASNFNLGFPASDIQEITPGDTKENPVQMMVNFFGLGGPFGPLPASYNQIILERYNKKDRAMTRFFNNLNHRLISVLYRALKLYKPVADGNSVETERFATLVLSILGVGNSKLKGRMAMSDRAMLSLGGVFASGSRSIKGMEHILSTYFKVDIKIKPFKGGWDRIPQRQWTQLNTKSSNNILGNSFVLGKKAWTEQGRFYIHVGPLNFKQYRAFLPTGTAFKPFKHLVYLYLGREFDFKIFLDLKANEIPGTQLGQKVKRQRKKTVPMNDKPRLGWNFFLKSSTEVPETKVVACLDANNEY